MRPTATHDPERGRRALLAVALVAATLLAYAPALRAGYVWDDDDYVTRNPLLTAPDGLGRIWFSLDAPSQYFPLTYTTFRVEHALWGDAPLGYHLVNVLLHAANALLLWHLLRRLGAPGAGFAAAIFALHPVHVESVAWISERKNVLSLLFFLASLTAWLRFAGEGSSRSRATAYGASFAFYALALFAKTTACTLPAAQLLLLWLRGQRIDARRLLQVAPFVAWGALMGVVTVLWERFHQGTAGERFALAPVEAVLVASRALWFYLGKLAWPVDLSFSYPKFAVDPGDPRQWAWLAALATLFLALFWWRRRIGRAPLAAGLFFVAMLSPLLGFVPLYTFFYTYVADHYQYVASIGPIALFAGVATRASRRPGGLVRRLRVPAAGALLLALGGLAFAQSRAYESSETLWRDVIAKHPESWMAHTNLGRALARQRRFEEAIESYRAALAVRPELHLPHRGIAVCLLQLGREDEAVAHLEAALARKPDYGIAHGDLAQIALRRGRLDQALAHARAWAQAAPGDARAHFLLGRTLAALGREGRARAEYRRALDLDPHHRAARRALARRPGPAAAETPGD
jgi:tetratricopeptide (TPR) repeat protein